MSQGLKPTTQWDEDYLRDDVLARAHGNEHNWVEFKESRLVGDLKQEKVNHFLNEMGKQLSAFGNGEGGYIIIGVAEERNEQRHTLRIDGGVPLDLKGGTKEWLDRVLPDVTAEPTTAFNVYPIERTGKDDSKIEKGKAVFVIELRQHESAPIQAVFDKKFYLRIAGQSPPMSKQQIWDIANRQKHPKVEIEEVQLWETAQTSKGIPVNRDLYTDDLTWCFSIVLANRGRIMAGSVGLTVVIPSCADMENIPTSRGIDRPTRSQGDYTAYLFSVTDPLFPGQRKEYRLGTLRIRKTSVRGKPELRSRDNMGIAVYADHAPARTWKYVLSEVPAIREEIEYWWRTNQNGPNGYWETPNADPDFRTEDYL